LLVKQRTIFKKTLVFYLLCVGFLTTLSCCTRPSHRDSDFYTTGAAVGDCCNPPLENLTAAEVRSCPD